jgi:hypothetical protein
MPGDRRTYLNTSVDFTVRRAGSRVPGGSAHNRLTEHRHDRQRLGVLSHSTTSRRACFQWWHRKAVGYLMIYNAACLKLLCARQGNLTDIDEMVNLMPMHASQSALLNQVAQ